MRVLPWALLSATLVLAGVGCTPGSSLPDSADLRAELEADPVIDAAAIRSDGRPALEVMVRHGRPLKSGPSSRLTIPIRDDADPRQVVELHRRLAEQLAPDDNAVGTVYLRHAGAERPSSFHTQVTAGDRTVARLHQWVDLSRPPGVILTEDLRFTLEPFSLDRSGLPEAERAPSIDTLRRLLTAADPHRRPEAFEGVLVRDRGPAVATTGPDTELLDDEVWQSVTRSPLARVVDTIVFGPQRNRARASDRALAAETSVDSAPPPADHPAGAPRIVVRVVDGQAGDLFDSDVIEALRTTAGIGSVTVEVRRTPPVGHGSEPRHLIDLRRCDTVAGRDVGHTPPAVPTDPEPASRKDRDDTDRRFAARLWRELGCA